MSKGSNRRPSTVPRATVDANYARTFAVPNPSITGPGTYYARGEHRDPVSSFQTPTDLVVEIVATRVDRTDAQG